MVIIMEWREGDCGGGGDWWVDGWMDGWMDWWVGGDSEWVRGLRIDG